jgi:hypothetical protein
MRKHFLFLFISITAIAFKSYAQKAELSKAEINRMISTYTFYVVQNISLEVFAVKYPHLSPYTKEATHDWDREFLVSIKTIDSLLTDTLKETWIIEKQQIIHKGSGTDYASYTEPQARKYIDMVFHRPFGKMQSPILETLLIYKPGYLNFPEKEFSDGYVNVFNTKDLKRPLKINLKILCPRTWLDIENVTKSGYSRKYVSDFGKGDVSFIVSIETNRKEFSSENIKKFISESYLKTKLLKSDVFVSYTSDPKIDNLSTGIIQSKTSTESLNNQAYKLNENYHAYYKNFHITLSFTYKSSKSYQESMLLKEKYQKLIRKIVSNIVILSQWEQKKDK